MISVIIPCFNMGVYLNESIQSVFNNIESPLEIILVNDGSTDFETLQIIKNIYDPRVNIIHQENLGLATARNVGVEASKGEILFFLDSDNRVLPNYAYLAIKEFSQDSELGVVYGNPVFFGDVGEVPRFKVFEFSFDRLLSGNFIDACCFVRKRAFSSVNGFSVNINLAGWDDWEIWIKIYLAGWKFKYLNKKCFEYRVRKNSMIASMNDAKKEAMLKYIGSRHGYIIHQRYRQYFRILEKIQKKPFTFFFRILYYKYILRKSLLD